MLWNRDRKDCRAVLLILAMVAAPVGADVESPENSVDQVFSDVISDLNEILPTKEGGSASSAATPSASETARDDAAAASTPRVASSERPERDDDVKTSKPSIDVLADEADIRIEAGTSSAATDSAVPTTLPAQTDSAQAPEEIGLPLAAPSSTNSEPSTPGTNLTTPEARNVEPVLVEPQVAAPADASPTNTSSANPTTAPNVVTPTQTRPFVVPRNVALLQRPIERVLQVHAEQRLNAEEDSCWSMMHSFLGWGPNTMIELGGWRKRYTNAIEYVATNKSCGGRRLFYVSGGRIKGREGPGYQGHPGQFAAMLAQCNVRANYPIRVNGHTFTVQDLVREEQRTCREDVELTFKTIAIAHYGQTDAQWATDWGETWSLDRALGAELSEPVNGAACGGTHRLMAISYALEKRKREGRPIDGNYANAERYISDYHKYTRTLANRDGTFSSDWFKRRSRWGDIDRGLQTTGHIAEWLIFSLPDESLFEPHVVNAVSYLTNTLRQHRHHDWEVGPKGHAIRALRLYHQRVFRRTPIAVSTVARRPQGRAASSK